MDAVERVCSALETGEIAASDLTVRRIGALLGGSTQLVYHHYGSLDAFLYRVAQAGFVRLMARLAASPDDFAAAWVDFAVAAPALYDLMFHHRFDWADLRARGLFADSPGLVLWRNSVERLRAAGSPQPDLDARALYAALHGVASLAVSGRANVGDPSVSDRDVAVDVARRLVTLIFSKEST